jgi:hypothetical protein
MPGREMPIEQILSLLAGAPPRIAALTADLTPDQLRTAPGTGEWSANELLAHLRSCADVWGGYIKAMLAEEMPTLRAINPRTWIERTDYPTQEFAPSLAAYTAQRVELLAILEPLPRESWSRSATLRGAGKPLQRTVISEAQALAVHERPHIKQIARIADTLQRDART